MKSEEVQRAFALIIPETVRILDEYGFQHHCIEGAALLTSVLHKFGIQKARQLTVGVKILNPAMREFVEKYGPPDDDAGIQASDDAGGAVVVLGKDADEIPDGNWPGHLVVIVPDAFGQKHALLDLTITQADTPDWGIRLQPLCLKVTDDFVSGDRIAAFIVNGSQLLYMAYPDDHSYGDWSKFMAREDIELAASEVVSRVR